MISKPWQRKLVIAVIQALAIFVTACFELVVEKLSETASGAAGPAAPAPEE